MIAIPNMERPKSCWECRLMDGEANCLVTDEGIPSKQEGIHPDCPLIDIVTCGECKYWENGTCEQWSDPHEFDIRETDPDGFCYYGERRSE